MTITREIVERARARAVADPAILIQGQLARDGDGRTCPPYAPEATCFCTLGLIVNEAGIQTEAYETIARELGDTAREGRVDKVIDLTDSYDNLLDTPAHCGPRAAGLAGFDYLLETMK